MLNEHVWNGLEHLQNFYFISFKRKYPKSCKYEKIHIYVTIA